MSAAASLMRVNARDLVGLHPNQVWEMNGNGRFVMVFDDGELETNWRDTIYSSYAWEFHRRFPKTPLLTRHHVTHVLGGKRLNMKTHLDLLGNTMFSTFDAYMGTPDKPSPDMSEFLSQLKQMTYEATNEIYNSLTRRCEDQVVSIDITDFVKIVRDPDVAKANREVQPDQDSIDATYKTIEKALNESPALAKNPIALAVRSKLVDMNQVNQCVGPRGFLTDIDSNIFPTPILVGYAQGIRRFHDSLIESRSAAKSLIFSKAPLQDAEYFSRRLQLMCQAVKNLHWGNCGSTNYLHWKVRGNTFDEHGQLIQGTDLPFLAGKYYFDDDEQKLKPISAADRHLIGKTLKLRVVSKCSHPDPYGVCSTCFGELSLSVPERTNLGHMCGTSMTQQTTQSVLSVKHIDGSSVVEGIVVGQADRKYLKVEHGESSYYLAPTLKGKKLKMVILATEATNLSDINNVRDVSDLNITRVSELTEIGIIVEHANGSQEQVALFVNLGRRLASMTYPMLRHIRKNGWSVDERGNYVIDMSDWDFSDQFLTLPLKHINMSDHSKDIANMLEASVASMQERDKVTSPDAVLAELFDLVNDKLNVNLAVLDVVLYGAMIKSADEYDYGLPKPWTDSGLGVMKMSMLHRSEGPAMAFQEHRDVLIAPSSFTVTNRPDHVMDGILVPELLYREGAG